MAANLERLSAMDRLDALTDAGVSIWLDTLSRELLRSGDFARLASESNVSGATSNPTIFAEAITTSDRYDGQLQDLVAQGVKDVQELFFTIALDDVREAADVLAPAHHRSGRSDGYVSFECTPDLADDTDATIAQARDLWRRLDRPNVMIKVPATRAGVPAIEALTEEGINVNVTLLFGLARYGEVMDAFLSGLERRRASGGSLEEIFSVASFFVSRVDTKVDAALPPDSALRGRVAVANARLAYQQFASTFSGSRWEKLERAGARAQRPLWASTGTKNADYSDVLYVEELIGPSIVNTMPLATLRSFADHGTVARTVDASVAEDERVLRDLATAGVDLAVVTGELEREGVRSFCDAYQRLLDCITAKRSPAGKNSTTDR
jgi:transaldolase